MFLVYEYVPNCRTLEVLLHGKISGHGDENKMKKKHLALNWALRIQIAIETAEALSYLHFQEWPILHTDVTAINILLDDNFHVKLTGLSLFTRFTAIGGVGTRGYLDPAYNKSRIFKLITTKSDVYSFGVVLMELISGRPAYEKYESRGEEYSAVDALNKIQNNQLDQLVDISPDCHSDWYTKRLVHLVAELACKCLLPEGNMRPSMADVLSSLKQIRMGKYR